MLEVSYNRAEMSEAMDYMADNHLGKELERLRLVRKWSLRALTERSGVSHTHIREIEMGKASPTVETLEKLATPLGVTVKALLNMEYSQSVREMQAKYSTLEAIVESIGANARAIGEMDIDELQLVDKLLVDRRRKIERDRRAASEGS
jgi:transcriptional regulator with XRE-family HTH domain